MNQIPAWSQDPLLNKFIAKPVGRFKPRLRTINAIVSQICLGVEGDDPVPSKSSKQRMGGITVLSLVVYAHIHTLPAPEFTS